MDKLIVDFKNSMFENVQEIIGEYLELGIDAFIEDEVLKEVPIVSTIVAVLKIGKNVHDRSLLKQTLYFLNEFKDGSVNKDKLIAYKSTIENNPKKCQEELERVLLLINNNIDVEKSVMLAKLFKAYINGIIDWKEFCEYSEIINRSFLADLLLILKCYQDNNIELDLVNEKHIIDRLYSLGIINICYKNTFGSINKYDSTEINNYGSKFLEIIK